MTMTSDLDAAVTDVLDHIDDDTSHAAPRPKPFVTALPATALFADTAYQRQLDDLRVQRMADDFDTTLVGVLEVSDRGDGRYAILDGQHRWAAALEADRSMHLVCQVHRGLTVEDEARVFYEVDVRRKALSGWDRWKARRGAGDPVVHEIESVVAGFDLTIGGTSADGVIVATRALENVWQAGGRTLLHNALFVLRDSFGSARDAYDGQLIQGAAIVVDTYDVEELDFDRLTVQLQSVAPRQLKARAQALKEAHRAEMRRLVAAVMVERYNAAKGPKLEDLLSRAPAGGKLLSKAGRRHRQLDAIRRWALRNGIPCKTKARIAQSVIDAYTDAHPGFELAAN